MTGENITCTVPSVQMFQNAVLKCNVSKDLNATKKECTVNYYLDHKAGIKKVISLPFIWLILTLLIKFFLSTLINSFWHPNGCYFVPPFYFNKIRYTVQAVAGPVVYVHTSPHQVTWPLTDPCSRWYTAYVTWRKKSRTNVCLETVQT